MKLLSKIVSALIYGWFCLCGLSTSFADTIILSSNNRTLEGLVVQTNADDVLILTRYAAFNFSKSNIKEIKPQPVEADVISNTNRLPTFQNTIRFLSRQPWATNLMPIAATVIDRGVMRNVPYMSMHCGGDYEINVYGDLENPSGIEIGVYHKLCDDNSAKNNCVNFISSLLNQATDKKILAMLDLKKDLITHADMTFEITPPTAEDANNGWWVSIYSEKSLNLARASDEDMKSISMTHADAVKNATQSNETISWTEDELLHSRPAPKSLISFMNTSGVMITDAEVVRVIDGVSLIWQKGATSGGMIRLADLPENLRARFGYDEAKTKAVDDLAQANKEKWKQEAIATVQSKIQNSSSDYGVPSYENSYSTGAYSSGGGSVYVHGYYRSNGTYVNGYTRSSPHRR